MTQEELWSLYKSCPPITRAAVEALLNFELRVDPIGYDLSYYEEDLPAVVLEAIKPWRQYW